MPAVDRTRCVGDEIGAPFQADSPGDAAQVNQAEPGRAGELQDAERALGCGRVRPASNGRICTVTVPLSLAAWARRRS